MPNFTDLGTKIVSELASGASGPLGDLFGGGKHGRNSVSFPSNVEGVGQRHFIRFNIVTKTGASFGTSGKNNEAPSLSAAGQLLSGLAGAAIGDKIDGPLGGIAGGIAGIAVGTLAEKLGEVKLVDDIIGGATKLAGEAISGIATSVESTIGQLSEQASKFKDTVVEKVPIAKDALSGIGGFAGSIGGIAEVFSSAIGGTAKSEGDIVLYMPVNITETYQADWAGGEMGLIGAIASDEMISQAASGDFAKIMQNMKSQASMTNLKGMGAEVGGAIAGNKLSSVASSYGISKSGGDHLQSKLLKLQGKAVNPHWELFFSGVQPRTFTFDFKMSPKNSTEGESIQQIVQMFKTYAAPPASVEGSRRYWGYPSFFEIEYWNTEKLHKLKSCVLQNITVNYSGDGTNHTFYDGRPMQTDLTLTFMESELLTRQDMEAGY